MGRRGQGDGNRSDDSFDCNLKRPEFNWAFASEVYGVNGCDYYPIPSTVQLYNNEGDLIENPGWTVGGEWHIAKVRL